MKKTIFLPTVSRTLHTLKTLAATLLIILFFSFAKRPHTHYAGRCTGSPYCTACTSCNYCKYCNAGGTCGICAPPRSSQKVAPAAQPRNVRNLSSQCQAITKKGTRCSRRARSNGFCWQHGG